MHEKGFMVYLATAVLCLWALSPASGASKVINGVPDWHQPCLIGGANGPDNGGAPNPGLACYKAWCVPTCAADIMGYWYDIFGGFPGIADTFAYASGVTYNWAPPVPADWQDDSADASSIPIVGGGVRAAGAQDLGWYLNCNDQGDQTVPGNGGLAGEQFSGTKRVAVQTGLINYLTAAGYPLATVVHQACNNLTGWSVITNEISQGHPLIGHFSHGNISQNGGNPNQWDWVITSDTNDVQTGEDWSPGDNTGNGCGHAMTIVGYYDANDGQNPFGGGQFDVIVVQDNRKYVGIPGGDPDNFLLRHNLKFYDVINQINVAPWVAYTTVQIPEPSALALVALGGLAIAWRRLRR